jgi:hypothetical protein
MFRNFVIMSDISLFSREDMKCAEVLTGVSVRTEFSLSKFKQIRIHYC